ncbi:MAG TPA: signal peptidase I [Dehalococcoidales bacterium]|nr:signal peptidase I [Dehalococcoidales bacterium]
MKAVREFIILAVIALAVFFGLRLTIQTYVVYGPSMQPNFVEYERLIVNKVTYWFHGPQRGDVIVFQPPFPSAEKYIKRVIGLPGESVEIKNGVTYIYATDGQVLKLDEPYIKAPPIQNFAKYTIPAGQYFVMGDNRNNSSDSRMGWTVPRANIVGKALFTYWPLNKLGSGHNYKFPAASILRPESATLFTLQEK